MGFPKIINKLKDFFLRNQGHQFELNMALMFNSANIYNKINLIYVIYQKVGWHACEWGMGLMMHEHP